MDKVVVLIVCIGWYFNVINIGIIIIFLLMFKKLVSILVNNLEKLIYNNFMCFIICCYCYSRCYINFNFYS